MSSRSTVLRPWNSRWFGWIAFGVATLVAGVGFVSRLLRAGNPFGDSEFLAGAAFAAFALVGAFVLWRRPGHGFGLAVLAAGAMSGFTYGTDEYARYSVSTGGDLPGTLFAAWFQNWTWFLPIGLTLTFGLLLFPTGRLPSRRWRPIAWAAAIALTTFTLLLMTNPEDLDGFRKLPNPTGVPAADTVVWIVPVAFGVIVLSAILSVASLFVRFARARGDERQQLKWVLYGAAVAIVVLLAMPVVPFDMSERAADQLFGVCFSLLPASFAVAMLRYRLYDVDVVINRTLVYALLSAVLAGVYVGLVFAFQALLAPLTSESDLAIAASTLAVAGLFRPARSRVQAFIDKRFYRRKVDAQRTLDEFTGDLRDEVDLVSLSSRLTGVVHEAMQPAHVSLWLREQGSTR